MAIRQIRYLGDDVLRVAGETVTEFDSDLKALVNDMFETMYHAEGIGLAAPQIGLSLSLCVLDVRDEETPDVGRMALVNPEIVQASRETDTATEGCLSIPGLEELVTRPERSACSGSNTKRI